MADKRHRRIHICPECHHKFKNFKWAKSFRYGGVAAICPNCGTFAYDWPAIQQALKGE